MDGIMYIHEILHDTKARKKDGVILKLDFEKAYDKINWEFLKECLKQYYVRDFSLCSLTPSSCGVFFILLVSNFVIA